MSGIAKALLATVLTLPLVAFVTGVLVAPEAPAPDRSRPVIIGNVDDRPDEPPSDRAGPPPSEPRSERPGREDDADDRTRGPVSVVTPAFDELRASFRAAGKEARAEVTTRPGRPAARPFRRADCRGACAAGSTAAAHVAGFSPYSRGCHRFFLVRA